jgi:hypothetical protein
VDEEKLKYLVSFLEYPEETALIEYKSAIEFEPQSDFGAKLVKHILGQANTGGGYIVIGFREDSSQHLQRDSNLTDQVSGSFETTKLSQTVDSFLVPGQRIELQVHKIPLEGRIYPLISTQGFRDSPYFCGKTYLGAKSKPILKEGAIYVRDLAAKTVMAAGPEHWNSILKTAVAQRQTEFVENLRTLLGQLGLTVTNTQTVPGVESSELTESNEAWFTSESNSAREILRKLDSQAGFFELYHSPTRKIPNWDQSELLVAAEKSVVRKTGWPIGIVSRRPDSAPKPAAFGIRALIESSGFGFVDSWALAKNGAYYFIRQLDEDSHKNAARHGEQKSIYFDTRIWRVAESLLHCSNLYKQLGVESDQSISIKILHSGLKDRVLGVGDPMRMMQWDRKSHENESSWDKIVPLGSIEADLKELTRDVTNELFMLFEFWRPDETIFDQIFANFAKAKM